MGLQRIIVLALAALMLAGCASRPVNERMTQVDPKAGYRPYLVIPKRTDNDAGTLFVLAFSGGGTRAAAFSYGVLDELRRTDIVVDGKRRRLVDEVDIITGVSGGSFTALAYALHGDRLFAEYEQRFLKRDVQGELLRRALNPFYWPHTSAARPDGRSSRRTSTTRSCSRARRTPICWRNPARWRSRTAPTSRPGRGCRSTRTTSTCCARTCPPCGCRARRPRRPRCRSSCPPVTFDNYGGTCGYQLPAWVQDAARTDRGTRPSSRALQRYREMVAFQDSKERPYLHLVDGGVADNIGMRSVLEALEALGTAPRFAARWDFGAFRRIAIIVVNARSARRPTGTVTKIRPARSASCLNATGVPIDRYSFETIEILKDRQEVYGWRRELMIARARLAGMSEAEAEAEASVSMPRLTLHVVDVSFDDLADAKEREHFMNLPTSFVLPPEDVDGLREVAGRLLRASPEFQALLREWGGTSPATKAP